MKEKIKIVIGINDFLVGGAQKLIADLLPLFDREKFEFHLISLIQFEGKDNFYDLLPPYVSLHKLNFRGFSDLRSWKELYKMLKEIEPDIVWTHVFFSNSVFRTLKPFLGYKVISVEHNTYTWKNFFQRLTDKIFSIWTHKVVAVSKTVAEFTSRQEGIPLGKFEVIYNGINVEKGRQEISKYEKKKVKSEIGFQENEKLIINVGRLLGQKNQSLLISAFDIFIKKHPDYRLIILGEGVLKEDLQRQIDSLGMTDKIFLLGSKKDVYKYYVASEFFVLTSKIEGFGIVGIEAMLAGLPMISTKVAGPDEYIKSGGNGFLTKMEEDDISQKIDRLASLNETEKKKFSEEAVKTAEVFDIKNTAKKYQELFLNCVKK